MACISNDHGFTVERLYVSVAEEMRARDANLVFLMWFVQTGVFKFSEDDEGLSLASW